MRARTKRMFCDLEISELHGCGAATDHLRGALESIWGCLLTFRRYHLQDKQSMKYVLRRAFYCMILRSGWVKRKPTAQCVLNVYFIEIMHGMVVKKECICDKFFHWNCKILLNVSETVLHYAAAEFSCTRRNKRWGYNYLFFYEHRIDMPMIYLYEKQGLVVGFYVR